MLYARRRVRSGLLVTLASDVLFSAKAMSRGGILSLSLSLLELESILTSGLKN